MKIVEVIAEAGSRDTVAAIAEKNKAQDFRHGISDDNDLMAMRMLVADDKLQDVLDNLQNVLGAQPYAHILVLPVETALPRPEPDAEQASVEDKATATREALYDAVSRDVQLDGNFVLLVMLSAIVAAIGLIENNVAVIIGAMVIAPLLAPHLALGLATALGDMPLIRKSMLTMLAGFGLTVALTCIIGDLWPSPTVNTEIATRTDVDVDSLALALASGAAAALSLTSGLSSVLVGVMLAVALLPPAATLGLMLGQGQWHLAAGAGLLLAVNVASVNLASNIVFFVKGIHPRTWRERQQANRAMLVYVLVCLLILMLLLVAIYYRHLANGR